MQIAVGATDGYAVGMVEGLVVGLAVGLAVVGYDDGALDGAADGAVDGMYVGEYVGCTVGVSVGLCVGKDVGGKDVGFIVGEIEGLLDGLVVGGNESRQPSPVNPAGQGKHSCAPSTFWHIPCPAHGEFNTVHSSISSSHSDPTQPSTQLQVNPVFTVSTQSSI